jgi:branched-chain amino acid transport system substrate-binding protein
MRLPRIPHRIAAPLLLAAALAACGRDPREPVVIAAVGWWGENGSMRRGMELAAEELRADTAGGRTPIDVRFLEDGRRSDSAIAIAQRLVADEAVVAVAGHTNSNPTLAAVKIYDGRLPVLAPAVTSPDFPGVSPWMFRLNATDSVYAAALARLASEHDWHTAAVLFDNTSGGRAFAWQFRAQFSGTVVSMDPVGWDTTPGALQPFLAFYAARRPDVVFHAGNALVGRHLIRQAQRQGITAAWAGTYPYMGLAPETAVSEGVYAQAVFHPDVAYGPGLAFVRRFTARFGAPPDGEAALGYDAVRLLGWAVRRSGGRRERVRETLAGLDSLSAWEGVTGRVHFDAGGDRVSATVVPVRASGGAWQVVEEP